MPRSLWGELPEDEKPIQIEEIKMLPIGAKRLKLSDAFGQTPPEAKQSATLKVKNALVTQTVEVMKQTEMLQSLIDTYSNKSGTSNYLLNPCQMIPEVDFPPENAADLKNDEKFTKPIWFVPPQDTGFANGIPQHYPQITSAICRAALRKAVCGQIRVGGFTDTAETALVLFADACEEFILNLMQHIREVHSSDTKLETQRDVEVKTLEKAYYTMTTNSLTQVHNYFKHHLIARNRSEIAEFSGVFLEYDKLMKESQSMQKEEFHEGDFMNIFEMSSTADGSNMTMQDFSNASNMSGMTVSNANVVQQNAFMSLLDGQSQMSMQQDSQSSSVDIQTYANDASSHFQNHDQ